MSGMRRSHAANIIGAVVLIMLLWPIYFDDATVAEEPSLFTMETQEPALEPEGGYDQVLTTPAAGVPSEPIKNVCELPEFAPDARRLNITIFVFAWRRLTSLQRLVESLMQAEYCGHQLPITFFVDGGAHPAVAAYASETAWPHGEKRVVSYDEMGLSLGIRAMWINASRLDAPDDTHVLPFEDDIEVSPLYYWWLLRASRFYDPVAASGDAGGGAGGAGGGGPPGRYFANGSRLMWRDRLVGISLYTPRLNEIAYPQLKWTPDSHTDSPTFLLGVPCSWGGLFFGSVWKEFLAFYYERVRRPFFDFSQEASQRGIGKDREALGDPCLRLPASRSNVWPRSWKRFMIDFMYGRGLTMLYPNLSTQRSFSTTYMERGGHSGKDGKSEEEASMGVRKDVDPLKTVPLLALSELDEVHRRLDALPRLETLPTFDVQHVRRTREALVAHGFAFTENIRWWAAQKAAGEVRGEDARLVLAQYNRLADAWSGVWPGAVPGATLPQPPPLPLLGAAAEPPTARGCALSQLWEQMQDAQAAAGLPTSGLPSSRQLEARPAPAPGAASGGAAGGGAAGGGAAGGGAAGGGAAGEGAADARGAPGAPGASGAPEPDDGRRYLVFQPPGGVGEYFIALKNAAGVARALGLTLVVPHLMWDGGVSSPVRFSKVFSLAALRRAVPALMEMDEFVRLRLKPRRIVMLHAKDPRLLPSRTYFNFVLGWGNVSGAVMSAQRCQAADFERLYGGCADKVLAFSSLYAAFEGFEADPEADSWLEGQVAPALLTDTPEVAAKAAQIVRRLRRDHAAFTCVHLSELDNAVLTSKRSYVLSTAPAQEAAAGAAASAAAGAIDVNLDVAEPAAHYVPQRVGHVPPSAHSKTQGTLRVPQTVCDGYDTEAQHSTGRRWVREHMEMGMACTVNDAIIAANLAQLPLRDPIFLLSDGQRTLPEALAERAAGALHAELLDVGDLASLVGVDVRPGEWPALEMRICADASALMLNRYSPLSSLIKRRAEHLAALRARDGAAEPPTSELSQAADGGAGKPPPVLWWTRLNSDACVPLFTRTARFDIQPNRFGILGQFGPERKLQLASTNVSSLIGWDGKLIPNASVELEVYVSNTSHPIHIFEYTKDNNQKGLQFAVRPPPEGWHVHTWHSIVVPITDAEYSYPMSTPWDRMDRLDRRLELYYANPAATQPRGDYIRIRNVFIRSTRSFGRRSSIAPARRHQKCSELEPIAPPRLAASHRASPPVPSSAASPEASAPQPAASLKGEQDAKEPAPARYLADASVRLGSSAHARRRVLLSLGLPLLLVLLAFSFAPRQASQAAAALCARFSALRRLAGCASGGMRASPLGTWIAMAGKRRAPTSPNGSPRPGQTAWSMGHGARDAHHRNVVG